MLNRMILMMLSLLFLMKKGSISSISCRAWLVNTFSVKSSKAIFKTINTNQSITLSSKTFSLTSSKSLCQPMKQRISSQKLIGNLGSKSQDILLLRMTSVKWIYIFFIIDRLKKLSFFYLLQNYSQQILYWGSKKCWSFLQKQIGFKLRCCFQGLEY